MKMTNFSWVFNNYYPIKLHSWISVVIISLFIFSASSNYCKASDESDSLFWRSVEEIDTIEGYLAYLEKFPEGIFSSLAAIKMKSKIGNLHNEETSKNGTEEKIQNLEEVSVAGRYKAKFLWKKGAYNSYSASSGFCETIIEIRDDFKINEKIITCPGVAGRAESQWYYRGTANKEGEIPEFKVWHAYGTGEYYMMGNVNKISVKKENKIWWNLSIILEKVE
jgi:hypothetical protein